MALIWSVVREIDRHPLRVELQSSSPVNALRQVRIALPIGAPIAVGQPRIAVGVGAVVAGDPAMRQRDSRTSGGCGSPGDALPVKYPLPAGIAPRALRIPVPRFDVELGVLAVRHRLPARREDSVDGRLREESLYRVGVKSVYAGSERLLGHERIGGGAGRRDLRARIGILQQSAHRGEPGRTAGHTACSQTPTPAQCQICAVAHRISTLRGTPAPARFSTRRHLSGLRACG